MKKHIKAISAILLSLAALAACNKETVVESYITPDITSLTEVDAQDPSPVAIMVKTNTKWMVLDIPAWVTVEPKIGYGDAIITVTPDKNFRNENTETVARSASFRIIGNANSAAHNTGVSVKISIAQKGFTPEVDPDASIGGIPSLEEFLAFADAVSNGGSSARWLNEAGEVELLADIDLSSVNEWTPICAGTSSNAGAVDGSLFEGVFDGKGHTIKGLKMDVTPVNKTGYGLFGVVSGGTIKNLTVETSGIKVTNPDCSANATIHIGVIAGAVVKGTIEGCVAKASGDATVALEITGDGTGLQTVGGIAGTAYESKILNCENNVKLLCFNETNTNNGGTGVSMAGIVGYCNGTCEFSNCINQAQIGDMIGAERWGSACRLGGIAATTQGMVTMDHCTNNGKLVGTCICTSDKTSRTAGIIAYVNTAGSQMTNCVNNGDVCFAPAGEYGGYLGGLFGQTANAFVIDGCESHGAILGDLFVDGHFNKRGDASEVIGSGLFSDNLDTDTFPEMGLVCGRPNSKATTVKNCKFSGKVGAYNKTDAVVITAANFTKYLYGCTYARRKAMQENADNVNNTYSE